MDIVTKDTKLHFIIAAFISLALGAALHQWLMVLLVLWALLAMGGLMPFLPKQQKLISIQWGSFFGLTLALAILFFTPLGVYN